MVVMELFNFNYRKKLTLGYRGILQLYQHALLSPGWGGGGGCGHVQSHVHVSFLCRLTEICLQTLNSHLF